MKIVFASSNPNKIAEVRAMVPPNIEILGLEDIGCFEEIPETADTIEENAILKADYLTRNYGLDCFADDSGLEVDALDGAPGVHSARYAGQAKNPEDNIDKLLRELEGNENRRANFKTVIALNHNGQQYLFTGIISGKITTSRAGTNGFGYDPIFVPDGYERTFAELSADEKASISHRGIAVRQLLDYLEKVTY